MIVLVDFVVVKVKYLKKKCKLNNGVLHGEGRDVIYI